MAYRVASRTVIDNDRNLTNIVGFDSLLQSIWDTVTVTSTGKTLVNREYCTVTGNAIIILPNNPFPQPGNQCAVSVVGNTTAVITAPVIQGYGPDIYSPDGTYLTVDVPNVTLVFTYVNNTLGWVIG